MLGFVANHPTATIREISDALGLTERQISRVLRELERGEMISVEKAGRRNCYKVNEDACYNHPSLSHIKIRDLVQVIRIPAREDVSRRSVLASATATATAGLAWLYGVAAEAPMLSTI